MKNKPFCGSAGGNRIGLSCVLAVCLSALATAMMAEEANVGGTASGPGRVAVGNVGATGRRAQRAASDAPSVHDIGILSYPAVEGEDAGDGGDSELYRTRRILLTEPRAFDREGLYIWRDTNAVWHVRKVSTQPLHVSGSLTAEESLRVGNTEMPSLDLEKLGCGATRRSSTNLAEALQFHVAGSYLDIDVRLNGKVTPWAIHIGPGARPARVPFRVLLRDVDAGGQRIEGSPDGRHQADALPQGVQPGSVGHGGGGGRSSAGVVDR